MGWIGAGAVRFRTVPLAAAASVDVYKRQKKGCWLYAVVKGQKAMYSERRERSF